MLSAQHHQDPALSKQQQLQLQLIILGQSFLCVILVQLVWLLWWLLVTAAHWSNAVPGQAWKVRDLPRTLTPGALENTNCIVLPPPEE